MAWIFLVSFFLLSVLIFFKPQRVWKLLRFKKGFSLQSGLIIVSIFVLGTPCSFSQSSINSFLKPSDTLNKTRKNGIIITESLALGTTLIGLNQIWYKAYPQSNFHFINDNDQWLQMDKLGHVFSSYHLGKIGADLLEWSGATQKEQLIYGATLGLGFLTVVEVFDGFSQEWGASTGDMIANTIGTALYVSQELLWNEQRITPKFSFHQTKFASQNPESLGKSLSEQILKDYNGQTYWLSFNIHSFTKDKFIPKWLNLAVGYGGDGMLYGKNAQAIQNNVFQNQYRQFYISFDVNLTKIETKSSFLKTLFAVFNTLKIPAPTLQYTNNKGFEYHFIYF